MLNYNGFALLGGKMAWPMSLQSLVIRNSWQELKIMKGKGGQRAPLYFNDLIPLTSVMSELVNDYSIKSNNMCQAEFYFYENIL